MYLRAGAVGACCVCAYILIKRLRLKGFLNSHVFGKSRYVNWDSESNDSIQRSYRESDVSEVIRTATAEGYFGMDSENPVAIFHDIDCQKETFRALREAYPPHFFHTFAVKSNPLPFVLRTAVQMGLGLEAASFGEVANGIRQVPVVRCACATIDFADPKARLRPSAQGCPPERIVFDSPAKTRKEIAVRARGPLRADLSGNSAPAKHPPPPACAGP